MLAALKFIGPLGRSVGDGAFCLGYTAKRTTAFENFSKTFPPFRSGKRFQYINAVYSTCELRTKKEFSQCAGSARYRFSSFLTVLCLDRPVNSNKHRG